MSLKDVKELMKLENDGLLVVERNQQLAAFRKVDSSQFHQDMCDAWEGYLNALIDLNNDIYGQKATKTSIEKGLKAENDVIESFIPELEEMLEDDTLEDLEYAHVASMIRILELDRDGNNLLLEML